ncbi:MAG: MarR family transcriptional regulator [Ktedonobacteraceae bacterium]|nr:MarR family transcriptional regulator [Ktedonobacteraceae bacterium]
MFNDDVVTIAQALERWNTYLGRQFGPLSRPQQRTLRLLADRQGQQETVRVSDLAEPLGLTTAGITRMLDTLEGLGYITRSRSPHTDQREVYVTLTDAGTQALQVANQVLLERIQVLMENLDARERADLVTLLRKLVLF